ncbi:MAG: excinuclease ABC subunit UvrA, partial [Clostridia bacterium]|nr:excinuclease ABC subunit UvrA [Clostridia bacterium]
IVQVMEGEELIFSEKFACPDCGTGFAEISPRLFSFNSPYGACPTCTGLGITREVDPDLVIPDKNRSLRQGAIAPWTAGRYYQEMLLAFCRYRGIDPDKPVKELSKEELNLVLYGSPGETFAFRYTNRFGQTHMHYVSFEGVVPYLERRYREAASDAAREEIEVYMGSRPCPRCHGARLKPEALAVLVGGKNIAQVVALSVREARAFLGGLALSPREEMIAREVLKELQNR